MASRFKRFWRACGVAFVGSGRLLWRAVIEWAFLAKLYEPQWAVDEPLAREFATLNAPHWRSVPVGSRKNGIWVEGHLSQYGPNYLARVAVAAHKLQELHGLNVTVIFPGYSHEWVAATHMFRSFGLHDFVFLKSQRGLTRTVLDAIASSLIAAFRVQHLRTPDDVLRIDLSGLPAGDLIYDDAMRRAGVPTLSAQWGTIWLVLAAALRYRWQYAALLAGMKPRYLVSTHGAYVEYGLLVRTAIKEGAHVVETTDSLNSVHREMTVTKLPTYHQGIANMIDDELGRFNERSRTELVSQARAHIEKRVSGNLNQVDVALAYRDKRIYSPSALREQLHISDDRPMAFIFAHAFIDSPHISSGQLYRDYYDWLCSTLALVVNIDSCHWVVKPHPSAALYGEQGVVERLVMQAKAPHVHLCPADLNPATVIASACCILTVQGTAALEYACKGIPAIVTGAAFYSGYGFTLDPRSKEQYEQMLSRIAAMEPLQPQYQEAALLVYGLWNRLAGYESNLIDQQVLRKVWGYEGGRDLEAAYRLVLDRMRSTSLCELDIGKFVELHCGERMC